MDWYPVYVYLYQVMHITFANFKVGLLPTQGSKLLGFRMSGTPKNGDGNPIFLAGFPTGNPGIVR